MQTKQNFSIRGRRGYSAATWLTKGAAVSAIAISAGMLSATAQQAEEDGQDARRQLDAIVVTADRRAESIQDVPIAVSAFDAAALERVQATNLEDLSLKVPNVTISKNTTTSNSAQIYIRGIGRDDSSWNGESGVALYIDGVILPQQNGGLLDLIEFERIEVLRGPQGTLYGRGATGGTVKFVTKRPDLEEMSFVGDVSLGSFKKFDVRGSVNVPLVEGKLAAKLDFVSRSNEGYIHDNASPLMYNGTDRQSGRLSLLWDASDTVDVFLAADVQYDDSGIQTPTPQRDEFRNQIDVNGDGFNDPAYGSPFIANPGVRPVNNYRGSGYLANVNWDLGFGSLDSTSSFREYRYTNDVDLDGQIGRELDIEQDVTVETIVQELQFVSDIEGPVSFILGASYLSDSIGATANTLFYFSPYYGNDSSQDTTSYSVYGEATYALNEYLSFTGGARYSRDEKDLVHSAFPVAANSDGAFVQSGAAYFTDVESSDSFNALTPKFVAEYRPFGDSSDGMFDDLLIYGQYQQGYKTGGAANNRPNTLAQATLFFDKEVSTNREIGAKAEFLDRRLRVNAAYFMLEQEDLAASVLNPDTGVLEVVTADAEMNGFELEVSATPIDGLTVFATVATLDDEITRAEPGSGFVVGVSELKHKPDWHYFLGADYNRALANGGTVGIGGSLSSSASIYRNTANTSQALSPETQLFDARVYYSAPGDKWGVELAGKNLTDEVYFPAAISTWGRFYAPLATWTLTFKVKM
ncbi:MAG: TonB-dependent receptor [Hyphomonas sp.]|nr:TonB-dependent receptor [Hyphomonas sp.]